MDILDTIEEIHHPNRHSDTTLYVNLQTINRNYSYLKSRLAQGCDCSAVVKANAYGLGVREVSKSLYKVGCRKFFVATFDEALELSNSIPPDALIYVFHGVNNSNVPLYTEHQNLVPVLNSVHQIALWHAHAKKLGRILPAMINVNTGMCRLGLSSKDIKYVANHYEVLEGIKLHYVMSHLACADTADHQLNEDQLHLMQNARRAFRSAKGSLANSSGIFLGEDYHFSLVRPGAALYGINPMPITTENPQRPKNPMKPVVRLASKILQVRTITIPTTVGYGATYTAESGTKIATIPVGYADGYFRTLGNKSEVMVEGVRCPVVGRISMDLTTIDVTKVPDNMLVIGAEAELLGEHETVDHVAYNAGTIGYEILTNLGHRFKRVYE